MDGIAIISVGSARFHSWRKMNKFVLVVEGIEFNKMGEYVGVLLSILNS